MQPTNHVPAFKFEPRMQETSQCTFKVQGGRVCDVWGGGFKEGGCAVRLRRPINLLQS